MLDIKWIKENPEDVITRLHNKGKEAREEINRILELDARPGQRLEHQHHRRQSDRI